MAGMSTKAPAQQAQGKPVPGASEPFGHNGPDDEEFLLGVEQRIRWQGKTEIRSIVEIGRELAAVKERLEHGRYEGFIRDRLGWSTVTAWRYVGAFEVLKSFSAERLEVLSLDASSLYEIASPSTPAEARAEVLAKAATEGVTHAETKAIIERAKQTATKAEETASAASALERWERLTVDQRTAVEERAKVVGHHFAEPVRFFEHYGADLEALDASIEQLVREAPQYGRQAHVHSVWHKHEGGQQTIQLQDWVTHEWQRRNQPPEPASPPPPPAPIDGAKDVWDTAPAMPAGATAPPAPSCGTVPFRPTNPTPLEAAVYAAADEHFLSTRPEYAPVREKHLRACGRHLERAMKLIHDAHAATEPPIATATESERSEAAELEKFFDAQDDEVQRRFIARHRDRLLRLMTLSEPTEPPIAAEPEPDTGKAGLPPFEGMPRLSRLPDARLPSRAAVHGALMVRTNRLYAAWLGLEAFNHTRDAIGAIGPARQLFFAWVTAGRPSYYEPLVTAPANVRETMTPLRALASACTPEEIAEFVELATAAP